MSKEFPANSSTSFEMKDDMRVESSFQQLTQPSVQLQFEPPKQLSSSKGILYLANSIRVLLEATISSETSCEPESKPCNEGRTASTTMIVKTRIEEKSGEINSVILIEIGNQTLRIINKLTLQNQLAQEIINTSPETLYPHSNTHHDSLLNSNQNPSNLSVNFSKYLSNILSESPLSQSSILSFFNPPASRKRSDSSIQSDTTSYPIDYQKQFVCNNCGCSDFQRVENNHHSMFQNNFDKRMGGLGQSAKIVPNYVEQLNLQRNSQDRSILSQSRRKSISNSSHPGVSTPLISSFVMDSFDALLSESGRKHEIKVKEESQMQDETDEEKQQAICSGIVASQGDVEEEECSDSESFSNEKIAQTEKKNVVKNFVKAFISDVRKNPKVLLNLSDGLEGEEEDRRNENSKEFNQLLHQRLKKFECYMKKSKYNNKFMKVLLSHSEYGSVFSVFLLESAEEWLIHSQVKNKHTHQKMLTFFQKSIEDTNQLDKLRVLKRNRRATIWATQTTFTGTSSSRRSSVNLTSHPEDNSINNSTHY